MNVWFALQEVIVLKQQLIQFKWVLGIINLTKQSEMRQLKLFAHLDTTVQTVEW